MDKQLDGTNPCTITLLAYRKVSVQEFTMHRNNRIILAILLLFESSNNNQDNTDLFTLHVMFQKLDRVTLPSPTACPLALLLSDQAF